MRIRVLLIFLMLAVMAVAVSAQDDESDGLGDSLYPDVPTIRAEDGAFVLGDPDAPVTVIEFADFLCPHCQTYHAITTEFIEDYVLTGQAKFEYRFFNVIDPMLSGLTASVAECAYEQDAFWAAHDEIYRLASLRAIDLNLVSNVAEALDLDEEALSACVNGVRFFQYQIDTEYGREYGVNGTPAIRVRVGESEPGVLTIDGRSYDRGGAALEALVEFVTSDDPASLMTMPNQLRRDDYLQDTGLIDEEACEAPCWRGIVPGETTFDEALEILEAQTDVGELIEQGSSVARAVIFGETPCCQIVSEDGETVSFMQINTAPLMTIGEVIERYGEPEYVDGAPYTRSQTIFNLYFVDNALVVFVFAAGEDAPISEESEIIGMVYLYDALMDDVLSQSALYAWNGYLSLDEYRISDFAITPQ